MPDARCTRGLVCKVVRKKAHTSIQVQRKHSDEVFTKPDLAPFVLRAGVAHGVEAALRLPSAPDAAASTASHPNVRDDGQRPLVRDRMATVIVLICPTAEGEYFRAKDWTAFG